jgi:hypothetical protein
MFFGHGSGAGELAGLVCADWGGFGAKVTPDHVFAAVDIGDESAVLGSIVFLATGSSAGVPQFDNFPRTGESQPKQLAPKPFVPEMAQRLLGHGNGGVLALIGHVDQMWTWSFTEPTGLPQPGAFEATLKRLLEGHTVGSAMEPFRQRHAFFATEIASVLASVTTGNTGRLSALQNQIRAMTDLRNFIVLGDPAVRLPVRKDLSSSIRPRLSAVAEPVQEPEPRASLLFFNGIDAETGQYAFAPMPAQALVSGLWPVAQGIAQPDRGDL